MSALSWNPTADFAAVADATEAVTLITASGEVIPVTTALRQREVNQESTPSDGGIVSETLTWHLPQSIVTTKPDLGGQLVDTSGAWWNIESVQAATRQTRWKCQCRRIDVAEHFAARLSLQRPRWRKDTHGGPQAVWVSVAANLLARVQPAEVRVVVQDGRRQLRQTFRIYLAEPLTLAADDRFREPATGRQFRILAEANRNRLHALLTLTVVLDA